MITEITREKMRQAKLKNPTRYWLGKKRPEMTGEKSFTKRIDVRKKMSISNIGKHNDKRPPRTIEHIKHLSESKMGIPRPDIRGKNSHWWVEDRTKLKKGREKSYDTQYKYWMLKVKKRDSWKCKLLNDDCKGRLESHHIFNWNDYEDLRYDINNGITLCAFHHPRGREEEKRIIPILQELLSVSKNNFGTISNTL